MIQRVFLSYMLVVLVSRNLRRHLVQCQQSRIDAIIDDFEDKVEALVTQSETVWQSAINCELECLESCSLDACRSTLSASSATCDESVTLDVCECPGYNVDMTTSTVFFADGVSYELDLDSDGDITPLRNVRASVCMSNELEELMMDTFDPETMDAIFVGFYNGVWRRYPAIAQETCGDFDPRVRPWYVAATSGPKNVVLVLDTSGSMDAQNRMNEAKEAAIAVLETLTFADYFAVVEFDEEARTVVAGQNGGLLQANEENVNRSVELVNGLFAFGATNFEAAFETAFGILETAERTEEKTVCDETVILFLTDGEPSDGSKNLTVIVNLVGSLNAPYNASLFTYSFGEQADTDITKALSCAYDGIFTPFDIIRQRSLTNVMSRYYEYFSAGVINSGGVRWVEPYTYAFTGAPGTTASAPIFDRSTDPPSFVGVWGIDLLSEDVEEFVDNSDAYIAALANRAARCGEFDIEQCHLEALRGADNTCLTGSETCPVIDLHPVACDTAERYPNAGTAFCNLDAESQSFAERACCNSECSGDGGLGAGPMAGIVIGGVAALGVAAFFCAYSRGKKKKRKGDFEVEKEMVNGNGAANKEAPSAPTRSNLQMQQKPAVVPDGEYSRSDMPPPAYDD